MRAATVLFALLLALPLSADEIRLKSGGRIVGRIVGETSDEITMDLASGGQVVIRQEDIEGIDRGPSPQDEFDRRLAEAESTGDANALYAVGLWARDRGMTRQANRAFERTIALAPEHEGARRALGYIRYQGQWMTREEAYLAMGLVQYEGEWITEAERLLREEAQVERERREAEEIAARRRAREERTEAYRDALDRYYDDLAEQERRRYAPPPPTYIQYNYVYPAYAPTTVYVPVPAPTPVYYHYGGGLSYHFHANIGHSTVHFFSPDWGPAHGVWWP